MNRLIIKIITYLVITAFTAQNIVLADSHSLLARDSNRDLKDIGELLKSHPGPDDNTWEDFNGDSSGSPHPKRAGDTDKPIKISLQNTSAGNRVKVSGVKDGKVRKFLGEAFKWYLMTSESGGAIGFDTVEAAINAGCRRCINSGLGFIQAGAWEDAEKVFNSILEMNPSSGIRLQALKGLNRVYSEWIEERRENVDSGVLELLARRNTIIDEIRKIEKSLAFPAGISQDKLEEFQARYGGEWEIEGMIGAERNFIYFEGEVEVDDNVKTLIERLNWLLSKLDLHPDTVVRLTSKSRYPLLYHKDDKILELHAILLTPEVDDATLEFIARHDERHSIIEGLDPWWEELLNIYIDIIYLNQLGSSADSIVNKLRTLEGEQGYWRILARRNEVCGSEAQQKEYLKDIIKHVWNYHPLLHPPSEMIDGMAVAERKFELLELDIQKRFGPLVTLWDLASISQPGIFSGVPKDNVPSPMQYLFLTAQALYSDLHLTKRWKKMEKDVLALIEASNEPVSIDSLGLDLDWAKIIAKELCMNNKIEVVMYGPDRISYFSRGKAQEWLGEKRLVLGYDDIIKKSVYIPKEMEDKPWARKIIKENIVELLWGRFLLEYTRKREEQIASELEGLLGKNRIELEARRRREFIKEQKALWDIYNTVKGRLDIQILNILLEMLTLDIDIVAISAFLLQDTNEKSIGRDVSLILNIKKLIHTIEQSKKIQNLPFLPPRGSRRIIQNYINLLVQCSTDTEGKPDHNIILLAILNKLLVLKNLDEKPEGFENLSQEDREYLEREILMLYTPLAEFLGMEDIADNLRDLWFKITNPDEYKRISEEVGQVFGVEYSDLSLLLENVKTGLDEELSELKISGIRVNARVKSIYSVWEKLQAKPGEYPTVDSLKDILGIQVVIPKSEIYEQNPNILNRIVRVIQVSEGIYHKRGEQYGYEGYDYIGRTGNLSKIEVQIIPSEKDYRIYEIGRAAHWAYKLKGAYPDQEFDTELLAQIQGRLTGNYKEDFYTRHKALSPWVFAGVVKKDKRDNRERIHIVRLPQGSMDADLVSSRGINELNSDFLGIKDVTDLRLISGKLVLPSAQQWCRKAKPGVFIIMKGRDRTEEQTKTRFETIKANSQRLRTYLLVSQILDTRLDRIGVKEGKDLLNDSLNALGYPEGYLTPVRESDLIVPVARDLGLANVEEFYKLLFMINQKGEWMWYSRAYQQLMYTLAKETGQAIANDRDLIKRMQELGIVSKKIDNPRILLLAYLITAGVRGKGLLHDNRIFYTNAGVAKGLELLLPEYKLDNLEQLYARLGVNPDFIYNVRLKYSFTGLPMLRFKVKRDTSGIYDKVFRIMDGENIIREEPIEGEDSMVSIPFYPPKTFAIPAINRLLDALKNIGEIERESVEYVSASPGEFMEKKIIITVNRQDSGRLSGIVAGLMRELGVSFKIGAKKESRKHGTQEFIFIIPRQVPVSILKNAITSKMERSKIKCINISVGDNTSTVLGGMFGFPIFGLEGIPGMPDVSFSPTWLIYIGLGVILLYTIWRIWKTDGGRHIMERILGPGAYLWVKKIIDDRAEKKRRNIILDRFRCDIKTSNDIEMNRLSSAEPWLTQAFFEEAVLKDPNVLVLDVEALKGLDVRSKLGLIRLINQVEGRVAVVSGSKMAHSDVMVEIYAFWQNNIQWLNDKASKKLLKVLDNIYVREDESEIEFVRGVYSQIQKRFKVKPENIMVFTNKDGFRLWRSLARNSLFYILDQDNLYVTSEDLLAIQTLIGKDEFNVRQGETIKLLPEYYYTEDAFKELEQRDAERGA